MKIKDIMSQNSKPESQLIFIPSVQQGKFEFKGLPCPTKQVIEIIGHEGVNEIHQKLAEILETSKSRFGTGDISNYGFERTQRFVDLKTKTVFKVGNTIQEVDQLNQLLKNKSKKITIPHLKIDPLLKGNNYAQLKKIDHYIIKSLGTWRPISHCLKNAELIAFERRYFR